MFADGPLTPRVDTEPLLVARSDALIKDLVAPPAPSAEVCPLCHSWKPADVTSCTSCEVTGRAVGFPLGPISVVTLTAKPSPLRDWLTRYKGRPGDDDPFEQASFDRVQAVLGRYLLAHGSTLLARIGPLDAVVVVPSGGDRPPPHPLEEVLTGLGFEMPIQRLLTRGPGYLGFRTSSIDGYTCRTGDAPARVLLVEDVFVTGARVFSAARALADGGHIVAGALVIARRVNRDGGDASRCGISSAPRGSPGAGPPAQPIQIPRCSTPFVRHNPHISLRVIISPACGHTCPRGAYSRLKLARCSVVCVSGLPDQVVGGDIGVGFVAALAGFTVNVGADDASALSGQRQRDRAAVSRARACDHGDRVLQATHLSSFRPAGGNEGSLTPSRATDHHYPAAAAPPRPLPVISCLRDRWRRPGSGRLIPEHPPGHAHFHRASADHRSRNSCDPPSYPNGQNGPRHRRCPGRRHARIPLRCHPGPTTTRPPVPRRVD